jgi:hypothetical protein
LRFDIRIDAARLFLQLYHPRAYYALLIRKPAEGAIGFRYRALGFAQRIGCFMLAVFGRSELFLQRLDAAA